MKNPSRTVISLFAAALSIFLFSFGIQAFADEPAGPPAGLGMARVTMMQGDTSFNSEDTDEWAALSVNFSLRDGDRLWAGEDSKIEVQFTGGHMAWINYQTELDINKLERDDKGRAIQVAIASGEASFATRRMGPDDVFQVDTPNASIRSYDKARFRITVLEDGTTQVGVSDGRVELETQDGISDVGEGDLAEINQDGQVYTSALPERDDWDDWVDSRWDIYSRPSASARYLPPDMAAYSYEFDEGGRWAVYPGYGEVWVPAVGPSWSPYSNGRWVWVAGDYVWLPYDQWYAPFHYGRWSWAVSTGWFWLPPAISVGAWWSPGYVGWSWGPGAVSWVPLGPREVYYGYGYYGPMSVNVNVTRVTVIKNVYVNSRVTNGVVAVDRNNFLRGDIKRMRIAKGQDPFRHPGAMGQRVMPRPPARDIKPIKDTRLPRPGVRPRALPPRQMQKALPILKQRAIARTRGRSAFTPGRTPPKVPLKELGRKVPFAKPGAATAPGLKPGKPGGPGGMERQRQERPGEVNVPGRKPETKGGAEKEKPAHPGRERQKFTPEEQRVAPGERPKKMPEEMNIPSGGGAGNRPGAGPERPARPEGMVPGAERQGTPPGQRGQAGPSGQVSPQGRPEGPGAWRRAPREGQPEAGRPAKGKAPAEKRQVKPKEEKQKERQKKEEER
jgi:hypothetical protein